MNLISRGAEANIYKKEDIVLKERIKKSYRIAELDEKMRTQRTRHEEKLLITAKKIGVLVPEVLKKEKYSIEMQFIDGARLKNTFDKENLPELAKKIAVSVALLHKNDMIHGDLTTSNMMMHEGNVYFIDFGLGFFSKAYEDKAVDLHLFEEALVSTHGGEAKKFFEMFLEAYRKSYPECEKVLKRLDAIRDKGRYVHR